MQTRAKKTKEQLNTTRVHNALKRIYADVCRLYDLDLMRDEEFKALNKIIDELNLIIQANTKED